MTKSCLKLNWVVPLQLFQWRNELEEIIEVAQSDSEQWVAMLAEIMKSFPSVANLNHDIQEPEENRRIFLDLVDDVTQECWFLFCILAHMILQSNNYLTKLG